MRSIRFNKLFAGALLAAACASNTELVTSWKEPSYTPRRYNKVLAVFISKDKSLRHAAEDELAKKLGNAVASYTVMPDALLQDREKAKAWVKQEGFDGAVLLRPARVDQETTVVEGGGYAVPATYGSMWGYWGTGWGYAYDPGYVQQDQVVSVEANVYSVPDDKLVWASRTKTYNPDDVRQLVNEIVDATTSEMKKQKVLASR